MKYFVYLLISFVFCCENYCNGHGKCAAKDVCTCSIGWGGADCSLRVCPFSDAFADVPFGDLNHDGFVTNAAVKTEWRPKMGIAEDLTGYVTQERAHRYAECSNAGHCDRTKGECVCYYGYEGSACQRRGCPSQVVGKTCSGHGVCLSTAIITKDASGTYYGWESDKFFSCVCDKGYDGIDCNLKECAMGVDPLGEGTIPAFTYTYDPSGAGDNHVSFTITIEYDGMVFTTSTITTPFNLGKACKDGVWDTTSDATQALAVQLASAVKSALNLFNAFSQATVEVKCQVKDGYPEIILKLPPVNYEAFAASRVSVCNTQSPTNICHTTDIDIPNTPKITKSPTTDKDLPSYLCARHGLCNSATGDCDCFPGYYGEACEKQRTIAI